MRVENYDEAVRLLMPRLQEYLQERGIDTSKNFTCLNPNHEDKNPSCGLTPNGEAWNCFSCGSTGTIFNACSILESKPSTGPEFVSEVLMYLADKYDVPLRRDIPTEEDLYRIDTLRAYRIASELVVQGTPTEEFKKAIETKGWSQETCNKLGIGFVTDFKDFKDRLRGAGFIQKFLAEVDLNRDTIFGADRLIFTIRDEVGTPVGFASRNLHYKDGDKDSKYVNQRGTGIKCNIYQKSKRLFGLDLFLKKRGKKPTKLFIFEGYSDVATAVENGMWNCAAIGGTGLTTDHIHLLKSKNVYDIILCLDGDDAGQTSTARLLDDILAGHKDLNVRVCVIPGNLDPDEFIRQEGIKKFKKLKQYSAFEWRLAQFNDDTDGESMCKSMIPLIINENSYIKQEQMCKELARATGFTQKTVQSELNRLQNVRDAEKDRDVSEVGEKLIQDLRKDPQGIQHYLQEADISLYDLSRKYEEDAFSEESFVARIRTQKENEEALDGSFSGFILGNSMQELQDAFSGQWKKDVWFVIGGKPNSGKTSLMCKLAYEIACHEKENNPLVIYHTIDDTFEQVLPKFVALAADTPNLELNMIMDPKFAISNTGVKNTIIEDRNEGYNAIMNMAKNGRLIIKDANDGKSLPFAENMIRRFKERYPDRNIVYILDNFHKVADFQNLKDERVRFKALSTKAKDLATKQHIAVITTVEYKKIEKGRRADNSDIIETGQIEYDANAIIHVFNEAHEVGAAATTVHRGKDGKKLPVIELDIAKNKVTSFKDRLYMNFWPASSRFHQVPAATVNNYRRMEKGKMGEESANYKEIFVECAKLAQEKEWNPGKVFYLLFEKLGLDDKNDEDRQKVNEIWKQLGGKNAVEQVWNAE